MRQPEFWFGNSDQNKETEYGGGLVRRCLLLAGLCAVFTGPVSAQNNTAAIAARQWRQHHERAIVDEFFSLLSLPNIARDKADSQKNADLIKAMLEKRGIPSKLVSVPGSNPVVFGEIKTPGATRTIVFYAHYDGQPLDPKEWSTPPFQPVRRDGMIENRAALIPLPDPKTSFNPEWRIYARSSADDKAPIIAILTALDAIRSAGLPMKSNIKFAFEGEEEAGSPNFAKILAANKELFSGDVWLNCDGPTHQTGRQLLVFGARGISVVDITVYGARIELHSGHYGNWAPNPAMMLAKLLASMKGDSGRILIDHFYDGIEPLSETEKKAIAEAPAIDNALMREFWLGSTENAPKHLAELIMLPSLNIRGMSSARTGLQASNVIPVSATATIDMRLVKGMDPTQTANRLIDHVRKQGYFVVESEPDESVRRAHPKVALIVLSQGERAYRTSMDLPVSQEVIRTVESARGPTVKMPSSGATSPDAAGEVLGIPNIGVPIANYDDNQHSFNENLRIQNLWDGIELMAALITM
jgi:acetylornithine deacetylase/succinyl-diaminopimelate desuccinylase-like protein